MEGCSSLEDLRFSNIVFFEPSVELDPSDDVIPKIEGKRQRDARGLNFACYKVVNPLFYYAVLDSLTMLYNC